MHVLVSILTIVMDRCCQFVGNYGLAVILFTFFSKIVLLPVSVWVQFNSIKMVQMQPAINNLKAKYFGDADRISEEQVKLFKKKHYHPLLSLLPLTIQILLLMGLVSVIKHGMADGSYAMTFLGFSLGNVPSTAKGIYYIWPLAAGFSAFLLCVAQNRSNVLQSEQSKLNQYGLTAFSVCLSLYLGFLVPVGVVIYWISSNLMAVIQLYVLNAIINPRKYVDYEELEKSRKKLAELSAFGSKEKKKSFLPKPDPYAKREKADYKRFMSIGNKHLVFYSENTGYYKYMGDFIEYILDHTNLTVHYITSDPNDDIFEKEKQYENLKCYYIGFKRLIVLMMQMDADIVAMTMPDLENFQIKRSYVRKDIEYIHMAHGLSSRNLTTRFGSLDHYDTIFCAGKHQVDEVRQTEKTYGLPEKKILECGFPLLDNMRRNYAAMPKKDENSPIKIVIAPSWQPDNIVDSCLDNILTSISGKGYDILVRPHPQHVRHQPEKMKRIAEQYSKNGDVFVQTDFSSNSEIFEADILITDWSSIAFEYAYTTYHPVLFINTPMKISNPKYEEIGVVPMDIWARDKIGKSISVEDTVDIDSVLKKMIESKDEYSESIEKLAEEYLYNPGESAKVGGDYIISSIQEKIRRRKSEENK